MKKNYPKKAADAQPNTKRESQSNPQLARAQYKRSRMEIIAYALGITAFVFAAVAALSGVIHYRDTAIWTTCVAIVFAVIGGFCWLQDREWKKDLSVTPQHDVKYSIAFEAGWLSPVRSMEDRWWLVSGLSTGIVACPVNGLWYIRVTNLDTIPIMIDSYSVEVRDNDGKWVYLTTMKLGHGAMYLLPQNGDWSHATQMVIEHESFDRIVSNKNIGPGETVRGWILLEAAKSECGKTKLQGRFHLKDVLQRESIRPIESMNLAIGSSESIQSRTLKIKDKGKRDISQARRAFYSEVFPLKPKQAP